VSGTLAIRLLVGLSIAVIDLLACHATSAAQSAWPSTAPAVIHSSGIVAVPLKGLLDLDEGRLAITCAGGDLWVNDSISAFVPWPYTDAELALGLASDPGFDPFTTDFNDPGLGRDGCTAALPPPLKPSDPTPVPTWPIAWPPAGSIPFDALDDTSHMCVRTDEGRISEIWFWDAPSLGWHPDYYMLGYTTWDPPHRSRPDRSLGSHRKRQGVQSERPGFGLHSVAPEGVSVKTRTPPL
jgi:hypothetical protein